MAADRLVSRTGAFPVEIGLLQGVLPSAELLPMLKVRLGTWSMPTTKPSARMGKAIMMVLWQNNAPSRPFNVDAWAYTHGQA